MKLLTLLPFAVLAADAVVASAIAVPAHHHRIARRAARKRRCQSRNTIFGHSTNTKSSSISSQATYPTPTTEPPQQQPNPPPTSAPPPSEPSAPPQTGVILVSSNCGDIGATPDSSATSGPNGSIRWLNCGIESGGWRPPYFTVNDVVAQDLGTVLSWSGNPFSACGPFIDAFNQFGHQYNVPPILIASIAMQESSCNPNAIGGNGEQGLMQITVDKCPGGAGGDACREPWYNIGAGADYLRKTLDSVGGNILKAIGMYNGWKEGMTMDDATRARYEGHCFAQNNLDYHQWMFNGWMQGIDPRSRGMGVYFNLNGC